LQKSLVKKRQGKDGGDAPKPRKGETRQPLSKRKEKYDDLSQRGENIEKSRNQKRRGT